MNIKTVAYFLFLFLFTSFKIFSQQKTTFSGSVTHNSKILSDVIIELKINNISKYAVTNNKGVYKFSGILVNITDTIFFKVNHIDYKMYLKQLIDVKENIVCNIELLTPDIQNLKEIIVTAKDKIINNARKSSYKIDVKDFIKNAKANEVLGTVPNINMQQDKAIVDGVLEAKIFIDGIETLPNELKTLDASSIDRIEVINNPSAAYGTDFIGAVINIITKVKTEAFFKGSIEGCLGIRNGFWYIDPSISYKSGRITFKSFFEYKESNQKIYYSLSRLENNNSFFLKNNINSIGIQKNSITKININLSDKSDFTISNSLSAYKFITDSKGFSNSNNAIILDNFYSDGQVNNNNWNIASVYNYKIGESKNLYVKNAYYIYDSGSSANYNFNNSNSTFFNIQSKNKEITGAIDYETENLTIFKKESGFYSGLKFINRKFSFSDTDFFINQNVINAYLELDTKWSDKFSTDINLTYENSRNYNTTLNNYFNYFLPTLNAIYHLKKKIDLKINYSRKILRPSASDLNDFLTIINPGIAKQGNSNLAPQIRNYYSLSFNKSIKSDNISLRFYNESINNAITNIYKTDGELLVETFDNAGKFSSIGMSIGLRKKIFKKVIANLNSGFEYTSFEDNSENAIINSNSGFSFRGNLNLSTKFFKDKFSISLSGNQNGPNYTLLSKRITNPYFDFTVSTNLLKDNLNLRLYCQDLLLIGSNRKEISSNNNFYQNIDIKNNNSNISISITYNFGKKFNDKINDFNIQNDDVRR